MMAVTDRRWLGAIALSVLVAGAGLLPERAQANGTSVKVVLSYLQGVSNFGPSSATGVAEILMKEGEIKLAATGLQPLTAQTYQVWLTNSQTGEVFSGGRISPDARGAVNVTNVLPAEIPDRGYTLVFLSVEEPDIVARAPNPRRSIAGTIPVPPGQTERPQLLPNTGGIQLDADRFLPVGATTEPGPEPVRWPWAVLAGVGMGFAGFFAGRRMAPAGRTRS